MMKPILFNTEMVQAILDGRKTVTRRVVKGYALEHLITDTDGSVTGIYHQDEGCVVPVSAFAPCKPGDILYVRETWGCYSRYWFEADYFLYRADYPDGAKTYNVDGVICDLPTWRPSIHMPKEAARLFLRVKSVRVERLQDIDDAGVGAEGLEVGCFFDELWDSTIKKSDRPTYGYDANPWVWVIKFERCEKLEGAT